MLQARGIAGQQSIEVISGARISLVKDVDRAPALRVDVPFENLGGVSSKLSAALEFLWLSMLTGTLEFLWSSMLTRKPP